MGMEFLLKILKRNLIKFVHYNYWCAESIFYAIIILWYYYFQAVEFQLKLLQTPTKQVIDMFYSELVERQATAAVAESTSLGTLDLIVAYLKDKEAVEVAVVQASNLPRVSRHGKRT